MTKRRGRIGRAAESILLLLSLTACAPLESAPTPADTATLTPTAVATSTPDPCTGWWCAVTGVVYAEAAGVGNELEGATVTLRHTSYCSPTEGQYQTRTGPDGGFKFRDVFFHDTDRVRIEVEAEGHGPAQWDSVDSYCLYCKCFAAPLEIVLQAAPGP